MIHYCNAGVRGESPRVSSGDRALLAGGVTTGRSYKPIRFNRVQISAGSIDDHLVDFELR